MGPLCQGAERSQGSATSLKIVWQVLPLCAEYRFDSCPPASGSTRYLRGVEDAPSPPAGGEGGPQDRSDRPLELGGSRGPRRGHRRQPCSLRIASDRGRIGQDGEDPQATATDCAWADLRGKTPERAGPPTPPDDRPDPQPASATRCGRDPGHGAPAHRGSVGRWNRGRGYQNRQLLHWFSTSAQAKIWATKIQVQLRPQGLQRFHSACEDLRPGRKFVV